MDAREHHRPGSVGVVGVFHTEVEAREVAARATSLGADPAGVRVGAEVDHYRAIRSEMQEEVGESWMSPQAGVAYPKEAAKGLTAASAVSAAIGALILLPFAALPISDLSLVVKLLVMAGIGAVLGLTIGSIVGPSVSVKRPNEGLAAERGVVVRVSPATEAIEQMMIEHAPIRIDRFVGEDLEVVQTEDLTADGGLLDEVQRNLTNPSMESDPGYAPPTDGDTARRPDR